MLNKEEMMVMKRFSYASVLILCFATLGYAQSFWQTSAGRGWDTELQTGEEPSARGAGVMRHLGDELVLFGGFNECFDETSCEHLFYNDVYHYNLYDKTWREADVSGEKPTPRAFLGSASYDLGDALVIYGGTRYSADFSSYEIFDDLWRYDRQVQQWQRLEPTNEGPGPRSGAGMTVFGHDLYLFAGIDHTFTPHNDLWRYNMLTNTWTQVIPDGEETSPPVRYLAPLERYGRRLCLNGGNIDPSQLGVQREDSWCYDLATNRWERIEETIPSRVHGGATLLPNAWVLFFGDVNDNENECRVNQISGGQNPVNETWVYTFSGPEQGWQQRSFDTPSPALKRIFYDYVDSLGRIYVWGGFDFECEDQNTPIPGVQWNNQLWVLEVEDLY